jgi:hypothetical protein
MNLGSGIRDPGSGILKKLFWIRNTDKAQQHTKANSLHKALGKCINCKGKQIYHAFLRSHKFYKILKNFTFEVLKKKMLANFQRIVELFTQKIVTKLLKI